ncbi:neogenin-like isoform X7, partial [Clarias magur]
MMKCLYLVSVVFHVAAGCALSDNKQITIYRHRGDSVLFPCSCSHLNTKHQKPTWWTHRTGNATEVLNDEHYSGRLKVFNNISPANLSLLISDLRVEDDADYRCSAEEDHRDIRLHVKGCALSADNLREITRHRGCELVKRTEVEEVIVFTGESVVLPCVCTDLQDKPQGLKWEFNRKEIYPAQAAHQRNRVSNTSPGNLSLLISNLTEEDQGEYTCAVQDYIKKIRLFVN